METELDKLMTVSVRLYGDCSSIIKFQIKQSKSTKAEVILKKVCQLVGLCDDNTQYFTLVEGFDQPTRRYRPCEDVVFPTQELTLYKWMFDIATEKALLSDMVAVQLLCKHASFHLRKQIFGQYEDKDVASTLSTTDSQFLTLCQSLRSYSTILFCKCILKEGFQPPQNHFPDAAVVDIRLSLEGLEISTPTDQNVVRFSWREVQTWSLYKERSEVKFSLMLCGSRSSLCFSTSQILFFSSVLLEIISLRLKEQKKVARYHASNIHKAGGWKTYDNLLYDPGVANPVYEESPTNDLGLADMLNIAEVGLKVP